MTSEDLNESAVAERRRGWIEIGVGLGLTLAGLVVATLTPHAGYASLVGTSIFAGGGLALALHGLWRLATYRMFVAWRYLLNHPPRVNPILGMALIFLLLSWAYLLDLTGNLQRVVAFFQEPH